MKGLHHFELLLNELLDFGTCDHTDHLRVIFDLESEKAYRSLGIEIISNHNRLNQREGGIRGAPASPSGECHHHPSDGR